MLLPNFFSKEEAPVYELPQKNFKTNKENDLSVDNKKEKVSFLSKTVNTPNLRSKSFCIEESTPRDGCINNRSRYI